MRRLAIKSSMRHSMSWHAEGIGKRMLTGQHLEQDQPEGIDVGTLIDGFGRRRCRGD